MCRDELPRIFELRDLLPRSLPPTAYFQRFEESLAEFPPKKKIFRHLEVQLQQLDPIAWAHLKQKLQPLLTRKHPTRGWQSIFDTMNEAKAYAYLHGIGCTEVKFIPESSEKGRKTPDLEANLGNHKVLCEVKTINISDEEAQTRHDQLSRQIFATLPEGFFNKLRADLNRAKEQMDSVSISTDTKKFVYVTINFDDSLHEYAEAYREQIQFHILRNIDDGLDIFLDIKPPYYSATIE